MIKISHRGNLYGADRTKENHPDYIKKAMINGYQVEIDVWYIDSKYYLGHDSPSYQVEKSFLSDKMLWCHAKNKDALFEMMKNGDIHCFWHQEDNYTITSKGVVWVYPGVDPIPGSVVVCDKKIPNGKFSGVCSDYIGYF